MTGSDSNRVDRKRVCAVSGESHKHRKHTVPLSTRIFDDFIAAQSFKAVISSFNSLCVCLNVRPSRFPVFFPQLKSRLKCWKAQGLFAKLDKRASQQCYAKGQACAGNKVLVIGCGPCGLRSAIEAQFLGAHVVAIEKRDRFSRNNVLHLWPVVIYDLKALGAKMLFGKFCSGSIDHISIRQLQLILLKIALLLGVEVHVALSFNELLPPDMCEYSGWHVSVTPSDHVVARYLFDCVVCASGRRNTFKSNHFKIKEFRGKLAIAVTANFVNRHTDAETRLKEISGVSFIFNQKFFTDMKRRTGTDLENIVYYKDDTHYFVMTVKKSCLLEKHVLRADCADSRKLLASDNVDRSALLHMAREAAEYATGLRLPEYALNHQGKEDVSVFDFTCMYQAANSSCVLQAKQKLLLVQLVGDSLIEPFWPTGTGCARGFLSCQDAAWQLRQWCDPSLPVLRCLAERESVYRCLPQTTPTSLNQQFSKHTLHPHTRYRDRSRHTAASCKQMLALVHTDDSSSLRHLLEECRMSEQELLQSTHTHRSNPLLIDERAVLAWFSDNSEVKITNLLSGFKSGEVLCSVLHAFFPEWLPRADTECLDSSGRLQLALAVIDSRLHVTVPKCVALALLEKRTPERRVWLSYLHSVRGAVIERRLLLSIDETDHNICNDNYTNDSQLYHHHDNDEDDSCNEIDEDEWSVHNFGVSASDTLSEEFVGFSDSDECSDISEYELEVLRENTRGCARACSNGGPYRRQDIQSDGSSGSDSPTETVDIRATRCRTARSRSKQHDLAPPSSSSQTYSSDESTDDSDMTAVVTDSEMDSDVDRLCGWRLDTGRQRSRPEAPRIVISDVYGTECADDGEGEPVIPPPTANMSTKQSLELKKRYLLETVEDCMLPAPEPCAPHSTDMDTRVSSFLSRIAETQQKLAAAQSAPASITRLAAPTTSSAHCAATSAVTARASGHSLADSSTASFSHTFNRSRSYVDTTARRSAHRSLIWASGETLEECGQRLHGLTLADGPVAHKSGSADTKQHTQQTASNTQQMAPQQTASNTQEMAPQQTASNTQEMAPQQTASNTQQMAPQLTASNTQEMAPQQTASNTQRLADNEDQVCGRVRVDAATHGGRDNTATASGGETCQHVAANVSSAPHISTSCEAAGAAVGESGEGERARSAFTASRSMSFLCGRYETLPGDIVHQLVTERLNLTAVRRRVESRRRGATHRSRTLAAPVSHFTWRHPAPPLPPVSATSQLS